MDFPSTLSLVSCRRFLPSLGSLAKIGARTMLKKYFHHSDSLIYSVR